MSCVALVLQGCDINRCMLSGTIIKRTVHNNFSGLFFGLPFTKPNPDFVQSVKQQFPADSKLLVVCQEGLRLAATTADVIPCLFGIRMSSSFAAYFIVAPGAFLFITFFPEQAEKLLQMSPAS
ncbi:hypothetical protein B296_00012926 [Ensete ventricosum]|uniref:Rhodanese domain-containing protein n=1 Tax=Ensete ventricosum TaxID=4639 RepID=A0A427B8X5_ENSVE|nr:hypothetical protein B296_00012926 [Ensete ventricosum]